MEIGADPLGNLQRLSNALDGLSGKMADVEQKLANVEHQLETAKVEVTKPFPQEAELSEKLERLAELNALLNMDEKGDSAMVMDDDEQEIQSDEKRIGNNVGIEKLLTLNAERIGEDKSIAQDSKVSNSRISIKEKLSTMRSIAEKNNIKKGIVKKDENVRKNEVVL